ncbi:MAG: hypothetical protein K9J17_15700 [Flavobacteriales bacterium]|nr:hypothetical protein [Flavobacteriales bacterium]
MKNVQSNDVLSKMKNIALGRSVSALSLRLIPYALEGTTAALPPSKGGAEERGGGFYHQGRTCTL